MAFYLDICIRIPIDLYRYNDLLCLFQSNHLHIGWFRPILVFFYTDCGVIPYRYVFFYTDRCFSRSISALLYRLVLIDKVLLWSSRVFHRYQPCYAFVQPVSHDYIFLPWPLCFFTGMRSLRFPYFFQEKIIWMHLNEYGSIPHGVSVFPYPTRMCFTGMGSTTLVDVIQSHQVNQNTFVSFRYFFRIE